MQANIWWEVCYKAFDQHYVTYLEVSGDDRVRPYQKSAAGTGHGLDELQDLTALQPHLLMQSTGLRRCQQLVA
jgi:hypothetical protein